MIGAPESDEYAPEMMDGDVPIRICPKPLLWWYWNAFWICRLWGFARLIQIGLGTRQCVIGACHLHLFIMASAGLMTSPLVLSPFTHGIKQRRRWRPFRTYCYTPWSRRRGWTGLRQAFGSRGCSTLAVGSLNFGQRGLSNVYFLGRKLTGISCLSCVVCGRWGIPVISV